MAALGQSRAPYSDGYVGGLTEKRADQRALCLDAPRAQVSAKGARPGRTSFLGEHAPPADAPGADAKASHRLAVLRAGLHNGKNPDTKVGGRGFRQVCHPPPPAQSLKQTPGAMGLPI